MIHTIRVISKNELEDHIGNNMLTDAKKHLKTPLTKIRSSKVYRLEGVSEKDIKKITETLFSESINQTFTIDKPIFNGQSKTIEIAYKPGVMNPEVASVIKAAQDLGIKLSAADTSKEYVFFGNVNKDEIQTLVRKLRLFNPLTEHVIENEPQTLIMEGKEGETTTVPLRDMSDEQLLAASRDKLFLNLVEMKVIQQYFLKIKRDPTECELETLAQTWSEHCAHKTFKAKLTVDGKKKKPLIQRLKDESRKHSTQIVSAFVDNSGVMEFYDGMCICGKAETHNSPSAIEPYGGAMTGSGGVFRDVVGTGQGAKAIVSTDIFCFAPYDMSVSKLPEGCLPPDYLLRRCVQAVRDYGNRVGIPTNNGSFHFHEDFRAKPTVLVGSYGLIPKKYAKKGQAKKGDVIVAIGGRTGRDGIHGATFSSGEMTDRTINVNSTAVQIGNAIEEKRVFDAISEARDANLIRAITDCGAGGFSSAIGEMGEKTGVTVHLEKAPLKYTGLAPWEIWISESQERMVLATSKKNLPKLLKICKKHNVEPAVLGKFDGSKRLKVMYKKQTICNLSMEFLHHGLPQREMVAHRSDVILSKAKELDSSAKSHRMTQLSVPKTEKEWITRFKKVLSHGNVNSKEPIVRLYDHTVQGTNALPPFVGETMSGPTDASVVRPILGKPYGMVISHGLNPVLNNTNPYQGSLWAGVEALSNYVAVGGDYKQASLINNYIWPFPDEESLWTLDRCVDAVVDFMKAFKTPVISGKDSLSSTYRSKDGKVIKIPPVLCISVFGKIPDVSKLATSALKQTNSILVLVGKQDTDAMTGSIYYQTLHAQGENIPNNDLKILPKVFNAIHKGITNETILSCHDISEGGMVTALFEMCVGGNKGATIDIDVIASKAKQSRPDFVLFNETAGTFLVEVADEKTATKLFKNVPYTIIGETQKEQTLTVTKGKQQLFKSSIDSLKKTWQKPMEEFFA